MLAAVVALGCSKSSPPPPIPPNEVVAGTIAGHAFRAKSAILDMPIHVSSSVVPPPPMVMLYESDVTCDRRHAAMFTEKNVRIRNLPNEDRPGRQRVWFDFCLRYDTLPVVDGFSWSTPDDRAGIRLVGVGPDAPTLTDAGPPSVTELGEGALYVAWFVGRHSPLAVGDPRLPESRAFHL